MIDFPHKIDIPQRPADLVSRSRLTELLGPIADWRLVTVVAPAGYGKTSLLIDFAQTASLPVCWYALDSFDRNPWVFLEYLVIAVELRFPGSMKQTLTLLAGLGKVPFQTVVASFARDIYAIGHDFIVIIDDWHLVDGVGEISELIAYLLLRCVRCHFILASRTYLTLPDITLLTARRQMQSLNEQQLRFTSTEAAAVLGTGYGTMVSEELATTLTERCNGWITGILLSFQAAAITGPSFTGQDGMEHQVSDFLAEQVFHRQPPDVQLFLLASSLLEELTPHYCDALLHRKDSRRLMEQLRQRHLFVHEIKPDVIRYHPLFREFLQNHYATIDPDGYQKTALQVANAYAGQGQWLLAFERYVALGQQSAATQVIAAGGEQLYRSGRFETLEHWFSAVPLELLSARLICLKARLSIKRGNHGEARLLAQMAELCAQPGDEPIILLLQAQLARIGGRYEQALEIAREVLDTTDEVDRRAEATRTMGICYHRLGQLSSAIDAFKAALVIEQQCGDLYQMARLQRDIGICYKEIGLLDDAEGYFDHADTYWALIGNAGFRALSLNSKGSVQHLKGQFVAANDTFCQALQYARDAVVPDYEVIVLSSLGDLYADLQLWERALTAYDDASNLGGSAYMTDYLSLQRIRLLLRQGQHTEAARELRRIPEAMAQREAVAVSLLSAGVAHGLGDHHQALQDIKAAIDGLDQGNAPVELARAHLLHAQILAKTQSEALSACLAPLERASQIATQLGYDAFLAVEVPQIRDALDRAVRLGWSVAALWMQRHQDIMLAAKAIRNVDSRPSLAIRALGANQVLFDGQPINVRWQKAQEMLFYLLAHPDGAGIDVLSEAIWPDLGGTRGRDAARAAIHQLRSELPRELIELQARRIYRLNREIVQLDYDVERFLQLLDQAESRREALFEALEMYRGPYLATLDNQWCTTLRAHFERLYLHALHSAAQSCIQRQAFADALMFFQCILATDVLDETAHAGVMRCHLALGNRGAAINQYQLLRRVLDEELGFGTDSSSEVEQIYRALLAAS